jgi:thiosulfate dehydrogenase [quinone] large subunit
MARITTRGTTIQDPPLAAFLFSNTAMAWVWLVVRVWVGYQWIDAALHKVGNPAWVQTGAALKTYWERAVVIPQQGRPPISFDWYRSFIQYLLDAQTYTWFSKLVAYGELVVGIALVVGAFVGIAAFFGALMNWNFLMAGTASTNPVLLLLGIFLILAWKVAGYIGLDRYLLPMLGTPWGRGRVFARREGPRVASA